MMTAITVKKSVSGTPNTVDYEMIAKLKYLEHRKQQLNLNIIFPCLPKK
ncbi:hypothetical protein H6G41_17475 [Tolypothrix sp. FACHB-123]|nr:hypothetical protein [Tolypothrix sp. FACHB-123]